MSRKQLLATFARDQFGDLRRDEAREFRALALDSVDQARVCDRDRGLVGERPHELDVFVRERLRHGAGDAKRADQFVLYEDWDSEHRAIADARLHRPRILRVGQHIRDVNRPPRDRNAARKRRSVLYVRMLSVVLVGVGRHIAGGEDPQAISIRKVELRRLAGAESSGSLDNFV
jgi:hypothetical protein